MLTASYDVAITFPEASITADWCKFEIFLSVHRASDDTDWSSYFTIGTREVTINSAAITSITTRIGLFDYNGPDNFYLLGTVSNNLSNTLAPKFF